jgi:hypothetical protein
MVFNSLEFLGFLIVVYITYRILPFRWQNWLLLGVAGRALSSPHRLLDHRRFLGRIASGRGRMPSRQRWTASLFIIWCHYGFVSRVGNIEHSSHLDH